MVSTTRRRILAIILVALCYSTPCHSFSVSRSPLSSSHGGRIAANAGLPLHLQQQTFQSSSLQRQDWISFTSTNDREARRFMAEADITEIAEESSDDGESEELQRKRKRRDLDEEGRGIVRKILIAGPLFCKFVIVLVIKFMTDLVVFPLLLLYRLARLTKRRIMKLFEKGASQSESSSKQEPQ